MINPENTVHVAGCDRVKRCEIFWMSGLLEALPDGMQRRIRATETTRRTDCDRRTVRNQRGSSFQGDEFGSGHLSVSTGPGLVDRSWLTRERPSRRQASEAHLQRWQTVFLVLVRQR